MKFLYALFARFFGKTQNPSLEARQEIEEPPPDPVEPEETTDPVVVRLSFPAISAAALSAKDDVMDLPPEKRRIIWSILSVFETGKPDGDYGAVAVLQDGAGISYGKHQATDRADSLDAILLRYVDLGGARSAEIQSFLPKLVADETSSLTAGKPETWPSWAADLVELLEECGSDPVMKKAQDEVFSERYWNPCRDQCLAMKLVLPLSWCAVYDTTVQSGPSGVANIRKRFPGSPPSGGGDEKAWTRAYLEARRKWLSEYTDAAHPERNATVRATVYRMDALLRLVEAGNWDLVVPISIQKPKATVV